VEKLWRKRRGGREGYEKHQMTSRHSS
jgi:hypothetical protein